MRSIVTKSVVTCLELDEDETRWLRALVQNTTYECLDDEPLKEREIRLQFWNALKGVEL